MPIDLHQRLSEFSYGYGVTREAERLLRSVGLRPTPFLPNLLHEAKLGFDVAFGWHRIVYDQSSVFVCSEPTQLEEQNVDGLADRFIPI